MGKGWKKDKEEDSQEKPPVQKMCPQKLEETFPPHIQVITAFQFLWSYIDTFGLAQTCH